MNEPTVPEHANRILIIDDNPAIHEDIKKILCPSQSDSPALTEAEMVLFGGESAPPRREGGFEIDSAYQGQEGLKKVEAAVAEGRPYAMAFVDERMPPGWSGIETIRHIWERHPDLQFVICTAYSDHSWEDIIRQTGKTDSLLILKKPFDSVEILQLAHALTKKWLVTRQARVRLEDLETIVKQRTQELVQANDQLRAEIWRRARVEASLSESRERLRKFFESTSAALAILRADTLQHIEVNESYLALAGYSRAALLGKSPAELRLPVNLPQFEEAIKALQVGYQIQNIEMEIRGGDQHLHHAIVSIVPMSLDEGPCYLITLTDVTDRHKMEAQFRHAQRMEAIGQLAAGVAHDFNNLLTVIQGHASIQLSKASLDKAVSHSFEEVKTAADRAASLTRQLLNFSHKQPVNRKAQDLAATLKRMHSMLPRLLGETIRLRCTSEKDLPFINADESSIEQVIMNLVVNARDAMPGGGEVSVEAATVARAGGRPHSSQRVVRLSVRDTGCGMDEKTRERIFDPFFTTKPVGKGTGLGLSMVYGIVQQHDGWIEVQSTPGVGSTFEIFLPAVAEAPATPCAQQTTPLILPGNGNILVAEDESSVRLFVCEALRQNGYTVRDARDGDEAMAIWEQSPHTFRLLLTDMVMPGNLTGKLLAQKLLQQDTGLKVVYMTGYSADFVAGGPALNEGANFLAKPFTRDQLLLAIQQALHAGEAKAAVAAAAPA